MIRSVIWREEKLFLLDQTKLPEKLEYEEQQNSEQVWDSIKKLKVRGAPAIGVAAAYGLITGIRDSVGLSIEEFLIKIRKEAEYLNTSRPTAVNLSWVLKRMTAAAEAAAETENDASGVFFKLKEEAVSIHEEDKQLSRKMAENGVSLIKDGTGVMTYCNTGTLAASELGTALAPMYLAHEKGTSFRVYACETRPLLQGARLTSWELQQAGIDVTLITDNMAAAIMSEGLVDVVLVGADRIAANGDAANKIGTLGLAVLASYYNIPFYVVFPASTIDLNTEKGSDIVIEERDSDEITFFGEKRTGPEGIKVRNPAFDVTPNKLITALITEKGIISPPFRENLARFYS